MRTKAFFCHQLRICVYLSCCMYECVICHWQIRKRVFSCHHTSYLCLHVTLHFTITRYDDRKMHLSFACHHTSYLWNATWQVDTNTKYDHRTIPSCASFIGELHFRIALQLLFSVVMPCICVYMSCWMYECVKLQMWMRQVAGLNASCCRYEWLMSYLRMVTHVRLCGGAHMNGSWRTNEWVMSHVCFSHVTRTNESSHVYR